MRLLALVAMLAGCSQGRVDFDADRDRDGWPDEPADIAQLHTDPLEIDKDRYREDGYAIFASDRWPYPSRRFALDVLVPADRAKPVLARIESWDGPTRNGLSLCTVILRGVPAESEGCRAGASCRLVAPEIVEQRGTEPCAPGLAARLDLAVSADGRMILGAETEAKLTTPYVSGPWKKLPTEGAPPALSDPFARFDGERLAVFGRSPDGVLAGALFDPKTHAWTRAAEGFTLPATTAFESAWTGRDLVFLAPNGHGAVFTPKTNSWSPIPGDGAPVFNSSTRQASFVVAANDTHVYAYGVSFDGGDSGTTRGGVYDRASGKWELLDTRGAPIAAQYTQAFWTGAELVVWSHAEGLGRASYHPGLRAWRPLAGADPYPSDLAVQRLELVEDRERIYAVALSETNAAGRAASTLDEGLAFDRTQGQWVEKTFGCPTRNGILPLAHEGWLLGWGGVSVEPHSSSTPPTLLATGLVCDLASGTALHLASTPSAPTPRIRAAVAYTGSELFVFGGCAREIEGVCDAFLRDGALLAMRLPAAARP